MSGHDPTPGRNAPPEGAPVDAQPGGIRGLTTAAEARLGAMYLSVRMAEMTSSLARGQTGDGSCIACKAPSGTSHDEECPAHFAHDIAERVKALIDTALDENERLRLVITRQLTPLDVAATHIDIIRRKGDEYTADERDNVASVVENHVKEARSALFAALSNEAER